MARREIHKDTGFIQIVIMSSKLNHASPFCLSDLKFDFHPVFHRDQPVENTFKISCCRKFVNALHEVLAFYKLTFFQTQFLDAVLIRKASIATNRDLPDQKVLILRVVFDGSFGL